MSSSVVQVSANCGITLLFQSTRLMAAVAELYTLGGFHAYARFERISRIYDMTNNPQSPQKRNRTIRVIGMAVVFIVTMLVAPSVLKIFAGPPSRWSGSLGIFLFLVPGVAAVLWVLFSIIAAAIFIRRGSSLASVAGCIGIGFVLALIGTFVTLALYHIPPYGIGP